MDEVVHDAILRLDADDELVVVDGGERGRRGGGGRGLLLATGEVEARDAEGEDIDEGKGTKRASGGGCRGRSPTPDHKARAADAGGEMDRCGRTVQINPAQVH